MSGWSHEDAKDGRASVCCVPVAWHGISALCIVPAAMGLSLPPSPLPPCSLGVVAGFVRGTVGRGGGGRLGSCQSSSDGWVRHSQRADAVVYLLHTRSFPQGFGVPRRKGWRSRCAKSWSKRAGPKRLFDLWSHQDAAVVFPGIFSVPGFCYFIFYYLLLALKHLE